MVKNPPANAGESEMRVQPLDWEDPLEEDMGTHSSILAWRIPWTADLVRLQSLGSQSWTRLKRLSTSQHKTEIEMLLSMDDLCFIHMAENLYVLVCIKAQETDKVFENFILAEMRSAWAEKDRHHTHKGGMCPEIKL